MNVFISDSSCSQDNNEFYEGLENLASIFFPWHFTSSYVKKLFV